MIVSITHEHDLDGLGSQAIIKRFFNSSLNKDNYIFKNYFAHYINFVEKIRNLLNLETFPTHLIISDIGFNEDFKEIFPIFKKIKRKNCKIFWFDHHIIDENIKEALRSLIDIYLNDPKRCAAEVVKDYYLPNDPIAIEIAKLARDSDFRINKSQLAKDLHLIIGYIRGEKDDRGKIKFVDLLSKGDFQNPWFTDKLKSLEKWFKEQSNLVLNRAKRLNIENFGETIISYAGMGGGKITSLLEDKFPNKKAYIGIDTRFNELIIHSKFVNCREFAIMYSGGGHKDRAGFKYKKIFSEKGDLNSEFIKDIRKQLSKY